MADTGSGVTQGSQCPIKDCKNTRDFNKKFDKEYAFCKECRFKCPNFNTCGKYRGKMAHGGHFKTCIKCRPDYDSTKVKTKSADTTTSKSDVLETGP